VSYEFNIDGLILPGLAWVWLALKTNAVADMQIPIVEDLAVMREHRFAGVIAFDDPPTLTFKNNDSS
jgi:hypothetical protein